MNHPPYHLRPNKSVDRLLLIEVLSRLRRVVDLSRYTYFSLGGPFLEDLKLLNEYCPEIKLVSYESDSDTYKRQKFHRFASSSRLTLRKGDIKEYIDRYQSRAREIFWLDFTGIEPDDFAKFMQLLSLALPGVIVKVTMRAEFGGNPHSTNCATCKADKERKKVENFVHRVNTRYASYLPRFLNSENAEEFLPGQVPKLVLEMLHDASDKAMFGSGFKFRLLNAAHYRDGARMLSIAGIVVDDEMDMKVQKAFSGWPFVNFDWSSPETIDVPMLSVKERLLLEPFLPLPSGATAEKLSKKLHYAIDNDNDLRLQQFAEFSKYYPYFAKIVV